MAPMSIPPAEQLHEQVEPHLVLLLGVLYGQDLQGLCVFHRFFPSSNNWLLISLVFIGGVQLDMEQLNFIVPKYHQHLWSYSCFVKKTFMGCWNISANGSSGILAIVYDDT